MWNIIFTSYPTHAAYKCYPLTVSLTVQAIGDCNRDTVTSICHTKLRTQLLLRRALKSIRWIGSCDAVCASAWHATLLLADGGRIRLILAALLSCLHSHLPPLPVTSTAGHNRKDLCIYHFCCKCYTHTHQRRFDVSDIASVRAIFSSLASLAETNKKLRVRERQQELTTIQY